ncbi:MAG: glucosaminidase domain-containing protein [Methylobacteriaceae bacterium]|nr:glucosaminidase domain-containing protein [Methylobacteriaceae bacterium]
MTCGTFTISRVPASDVDQVMQEFEASDSPPNSVTKQADSSGTFTVIAVFPPCPPNTTHDAGPPAAPAGQGQPQPAPTGQPHPAPPAAPAGQGQPQPAPTGAAHPASPPSAPRPAGAVGVFPADVVSAAQLSHGKWEVPASVTLAQWALESNWGKAMPAGSNNPFGIKASAGQAFVEARTREVINGQSVVIMAEFRKFASLDEAFDQHGRLLATSSFYIRAMAVRDDPNAFADALTGVYATAPNYGAVLRGLMKSYKLTRFD